MLTLKILLPAILSFFLQYHAISLMERRERIASVVFFLIGLAVFPGLMLYLALRG